MRQLFLRPRMDHAARRPAISPRAVAIALLVLVLPGCATLQEIMALNQVRFDLTRVSSLQLAGVELDRVTRFEELGAGDVLRIGSALASGRLPLDATLHVRADNPDDNPTARLLALDWTLFLQDRETIGGGLEQEVVLPAGEVTDVPLRVSLDLLEFYDGGARELVNLVLNLTGAGGEPVGVRLEAMPTVQTPLGPIRYPQPIVMGGQVANR
jgi:hypothetical protein